MQVPEWTFLVKLSPLCKVNQNWVEYSTKANAADAKTYGQQQQQQWKENVASPASDVDVKSIGRDLNKGLEKFKSTYAQQQGTHLRELKNMQRNASKIINWMIQNMPNGKQTIIVL